MYNVIAKGLVVPADSPVGRLVSQPIEIPPNNGLLLCVTAISAAVDDDEGLFVVGIATSNDLQNWETDLANFIEINGAGYFERKFTTIGTRYVRAVYATNELASGVVAAGLDIADL